MIKIAFWRKDSGNCLSHSKGLTIDQIEGLKQLKEGDRLILFRNRIENESDSAYHLKIYTPKERPGEKSIK